MLDQITTSNILFLDIETVPQYSSFNELPHRFKDLWIKKCEFLKKECHETPESLYPRAGIYAEFGKIICISVGYLSKRNELNDIRIKSFYGDDEEAILNDFLRLLKTKFNRRDQLLCGHNSKEFDFPFIARRILINGLQLPAILDIAGKKPWEVNHLDTMELWKFGDYKSYTSLDLLAAVFNIPTPKSTMDGSMVYSIYYLEKDLGKIVKYCERDVETLIKVFMRLKGEFVANPTAERISLSLA